MPPPGNSSLLAALFIRIFLTPLSLPSKTTWKLRWLGHQRYWLFQILGLGGQWSFSMLSAFAESKIPEEPDNDFSLLTFFLILVLMMSHLIRVPILGFNMLEKPLRSILPQLVLLVFGGAAAINGAMILGYPLFVTTYERIEEEPLWRVIALYVTFFANSAFTLTAWLAGSDG